MLNNYITFGRPNYSEAEIEAVAKVIRSGWTGMGQETIAFENELSKFLDVPHMVTVNSCTSALFLSLLVSGVQAHDEVICPSLTWCSTANVALYLGAQPIFCDVDVTSLCSSTQNILAAVTARTKAVIVVHFAGFACDVQELREALPKHIAIVEDCAHAFGSKYMNGKPVGSSGNLCCFSFYANKNLSTGEGGAIATHSSILAEQLKKLRLHGLKSDAWKRFSQEASPRQITDIDVLGYKMNYTDLNATIGRVQLTRFAELSERRQRVAEIYKRRLLDADIGVEIQRGCATSSHAQHLFVVLLPLRHGGRSRDGVIRELRARNVGASLHYAPLHLMSLYRENQSNLVSLPVTEKVGERILTLPISASIPPTDAHSIMDEFLDLVG